MPPASAPLSQPLPGASLAQAISRYVRSATTFVGRASKSEYWWVMLVLLLVGAVPGAMLTVGLVRGIAHRFESSEPVQIGAEGSREQIGIAGPGILEEPTAAVLIPLGLVLLALLWLVTLVPTLALSWRRLHDGGLAGPWFFLSLLPGVGGLFLIVLMLQPSKPEGRRFDAAAPPDAA
ncbi:DUF805 domain-containing protein [Microbacterium sp. 179-I 3D4 NHS]|uniref:DUF805 domain-containing protein n=1 Tax=Microbacterium sp. 179-I 3D4 NHS TaxID=3142381 RepID=UPI0039A0773C